MRRLKDIIKTIPTWLAATFGWRALFKGDKTLIILTYHRVLPKSDQRYLVEEPGMVVTPETFQMHIETLIKHKVPIVNLSQWLVQDESEKPQIAVSFTFDDGWLDNYEYAFPILKKFEVPSTLFVVSRFMGKPAPFWPNKLLKILLSDSPWTEEQLTSIRSLLPDFHAIRMTRENAASIIHKIKQCPDQKIHEALSLFSDQEFAIEMMDLGQIKDAREKFNIDIGSHTCSHLRLNGYASTEELNEEIIRSKQELEAHFKDEISGFCFPNGDYSKEALTLVRRTYSYAVTTKKGHNKASEISPYELARIGLHEDISNSVTKFKAQLTCWL